MRRERSPAQSQLGFVVSGFSNKAVLKYGDIK
jgi:hypothetical protein